MKKRMLIDIMKVIVCVLVVLGYFFQSIVKANIISPLYITYETFENTIESHTTEPVNHATQLKSIKFVGAKGDGVTDDTFAIQTALDFCANSGEILYFPMGEYLVKSKILFPSNTNIIGCGKFSEIIFATDYASDDFSIRNNGFWGYDSVIGAENIDIENISFICQDGTNAKNLLAFCNVDNLVVKHCYFDSGTDSTKAKFPLDLYGGNTNVIIENNTFNMQNEASAGCVMVRNVNPNKISENITLRNNIFYNKKADEALAVWGWEGTVQNVTIENNKFYSYVSTAYPAHLITISQPDQGTTKNINFINNIVNADITGCTIMYCGQNITDLSENIIIEGNNFTIKNPKETTSAYFQFSTDKTKFKNNNIYCDDISNKNIIGGSISNYDNFVVEGNYIDSKSAGFVFYNCAIVLNNKVKCHGFAYNAIKNS